MQATPIAANASAPLVRPDGSPAPVVHLVPELSPYARTGGLGEAVSSLAKHQAASGIPVTVFMPLYGVIRERVELQPVGPSFAVGVGPRTETARIFEPVAPQATRAPRVLFVESEEYFDRPGLYGDDAGDYPDNAQRYALFTRAVLVALPRVMPQAPQNCRATQRGRIRCRTCSSDAWLYAHGRGLLLGKTSRASHWHCLSSAPARHFLNAAVRARTSCRSTRR